MAMTASIQSSALLSSPSLNVRSSSPSSFCSRIGSPLLPFSTRNVCRGRVMMSATQNNGHKSGKEDIDVRGVQLAALAVAAAMVIPDIAEAAQPGVSPSLKNLLLSVVAGGVVLLAIGGAVAGVSTFDPVQRRN